MNRVLILIVHKIVDFIPTFFPQTVFHKHLINGTWLHLIK